MRYKIAVPLVLLSLLAACLRSPEFVPVEEVGPGASDAGLGDASKTDAASDASDLGPDAAIPGTGLPLPASVNVTGGWAGDLNGDGTDDLLLMSDNDFAQTTGLYLLFGQSDSFLAEHHQFMATGSKTPVAVMASQLDGQNSLDVVLFAVEFGEPPSGETNESFMLAYLAEDTSYAAPLENWISEGTNISGALPFARGESATMLRVRLDPGSLPSFVAVHSRGVVALTLPLWDEDNFNFGNTSPEVLLSAYAVGGRVLPSVTTNGVDDLIVWSDATGDMKWLRNDGSGTLINTVVNAEIRGPTHADLFDVDGIPPLDVIAVNESEIQVVPVDNDGGTTSAEYNGQNYIPGYAAAVDIMAIDASANTDANRPEILVLSPSCGDRACLYMIRNAFINGDNGQLNSSPTNIREWSLPQGFTPKLMFRGDFDGDGAQEIAIIGADGSAQCVRLANEAFSSC